MKGNNLIQDVGIYLRKSRGEDEVQDLAKHRDYLLRVAEDKGWTVHLYEEIKSSQDWQERDELQRMLQDIRENKLDSIMTYAPDRLSRRDIHFLTIIDHLISNGITKLYIKDVEYDLTVPHIRTQLSLMAVMAQSEYMLITQRLTEGKIRSAEKGKWSGGNTKFGYMAVDGELVINPKEYPIAREIVDKLLQGYSYHAVAKELNERGIKTRNGKGWTSATIEQFFNSTTLRGHMNYNIKGKEYFTPNTHEAILSDSEYQAIKRLQSNRENHFRKKKNNVSHWLSGVVTCSVCGWNKKIQLDSKTYQTKQPSFYIRKCKSQVEVNGKYQPCYCLGSKIEYVEDMLIEYLTKYKEQLRHDMKDLLETDMTVLKEKQSRAVKQLEKELSKLNDKDDNLLELLSDMIINREQYKTQKDRLEEQKENVHKQLREAQLQLQELDVNTSIKQLEYAEKLIEKFNTLDHQEKNRLVKMLFSKIEYYKVDRKEIPKIRIHPL